ncbi:MAG: class I SAM-dependent methyltransferase [Candidatus Aminicenantia bacterium]
MNEFKEKKSHIFIKKEVEEYERKRFKGLDQKIIDWREKKIIRKILNLLPEKQLLILDIPCGYGRFSKIFIEKKARVISADLSFFMVARSRERNPFSTHFFLVSNLKQGLPFKSEKIDYIFCFRFFHHLHFSQERCKILSDFAKVSRKWIIISYYQSNFLHRWQRKLRKILTKGKTKIKMISKTQFSKEADSVGLKIVRVFPVLGGIHSQHIALLEKKK